MKILVCVKQVPDMESQFKPDAAGVWFAEDDLAFRMNEYDEFAVEQAVQLKEQLAGEPDITALSIGPDRVVETLKKALAMGCDRAVHVQDSVAHSRDPWQIARMIASFGQGEGFDVVFAGLQSEDQGSAQVGVLAAEFLGFTCVTTVVGFQCSEGVITVRRELEGGLRAVVRLKLPAVVTCQSGLNTPRYPTLPNIMKATRKEILAVPSGSLLTGEPLSFTVGVYLPVKRGEATVLEGDVADVADRLLAILMQRALVPR